MSTALSGTWEACSGGGGFSGIYRSSAQAVTHRSAEGDPGNDLAGLRDEPELAKLPETERKDWQSLWAKVDGRLKGVAVSP